MNTPAQESRASTPSIIQEIHARGKENFRKIGLPSGKEENWRFTPLERLGRLERNKNVFSATHGMPEIRSGKTHALIFVNGRFSPDASDTDSLPSGCRVMPFDKDSAGRLGDIGQNMGGIFHAEDGSLEALNASKFDHGVVISIDAGNTIDEAILLMHITDRVDSVLYPRHLVILEAGAEATIIEHFSSSVPMLRIPLSEYFLGKGSTLNLIRIEEEGASAHHLGLSGASLDSDARLSKLSLGLGADLFRLDMKILLSGAGASATLSGLGVAGDREHREHVVRIEHQAAQCTSRQLFRNILQDSSRGVFTGRIVVAPGAQQTNAEQSSKTLLLSEKAVALNNPQMEIDADNVRCTHGSTVGEVDEEALFYLRARGIGAEDARALLTEAFAGEVLTHLHPSPLKTEIEALLRRRLRKRSIS